MIAALVRTLVIAGLAASLGACGSRAQQSETAPAIEEEIVSNDEPSRIALIIGNADYNGDGRLALSDSEAIAAENAGLLRDLANPINDARDIRDALGAAGFDVTSYGENLSRAQMIDLLEGFGRKVAAATADSIIVIYYSGHALQVDGENYLLPSDARLPGREALTYSAASLEAVMQGSGVAMSTIRLHLRDRAGDGVNIVILDACRNNPWDTSQPRQRSRSGGRTRGGRGLADINWSMSNTLIAYSTEPGAGAYDGDAADRNSPYTTVLKRYLIQPDMQVLELFNSVGNEVALRTTAWENGQQRPSMNTTNVPDICLVPCAATAERVILADLQTPLRAGQPFRDCPDCPEMVVIAGGSFIMGSGASERGRGEDEGPEQRVTLNRFALSRTEVTIAQWRIYAEAAQNSNALRTSPECNWNSPGYRQEADFPVVCISFRQAEAYAAWLTERTGRQYRLVTEPEWEYAARSGSTRAYAFGEAITPERANYADSGRIYALPVRSYPANAFHLFDMNGNVWEWVSACYGAYGDETVAADSRSCQSRVIRGGSWADGGAELRSANRASLPQEASDINVGLRIAASL